ncbi:hypothetical protein Bca101_046415 [Brassica carinata]
MEIRRTDNEIKNVWHTHLKKRLVKSSASPDEPASPCSSDKTQVEDCLKIKTSHDSTTPVSSGGSNNSNQEDDPNLGLVFEYNEFNDIIQEVDKPDLLEIPFDDSGLDIWSFLDGPNENSSVSRGGEECDEDEVKKWLKHLESELGLEEDDNQHQHKEGTEDKDSSSSLLKTYELMIH